MPAVIDVHHHVLPDFFFRETNGDAHPVGGLAPAPLSEARALEFMDDAGIDVAIKSISTPRVHDGDDAQVRSLAAVDPKSLFLKSFFCAAHMSVASVANSTSSSFQSEAINRFADAERLKIADTYFVRPRPSVQPSNRSFGSVLFITDQSGRPCRPRVPSLKRSFCHAALKTKFVTGITEDCRWAQ